jgi:hypothetical protein
LKRKNETHPQHKVEKNKIETFSAQKKQAEEIMTFRRSRAKRNVMSHSELSPNGRKNEEPGKNRKIKTPQNK